MQYLSVTFAIGEEHACIEIVAIIRLVIRLNSSVERIVHAIHCCRDNSQAACIVYKLCKRQKEEGGSRFCLHALGSDRKKKKARRGAWPATSPRSLVKHGWHFGEFREGHTRACTCKNYFSSRRVLMPRPLLAGSWNALAVSPAPRLRLTRMTGDPNRWRECLYGIGFCIGFVLSLFPRLHFNFNHVHVLIRYMRDRTVTRKLTENDEWRQRMLKFAC